MQLLKGKAAIVTGAGGGIGRGHCLHLARAGALVLVNDQLPDAAEGVAREIRDAGGQAMAFAGDVSCRKDVTSLVGFCVDRFGSVDILINNAGNLRDRSFLKMSDEEFDAVWQVHVKGTFVCSQIAARVMREQGHGGAIINTTSGAHFGSFGQSNYAAAKGAIASMTYTWAIELARYGIRVNAIGPTGTTKMSETFKTVGSDAPALPYIDPASNGPLVVFLCSDRAEAVSGQIFGSGGERVAHMVQPHYGRTLIQPGGWHLDSLCEHFPKLCSEFGALGMLGKPYPFHDGVKPPQVDGRD